MSGAATGSPPERRGDSEAANQINFDALARLGPPREPRPESRAAALMQRLEGQALVWLLVVWEIIVLIEALVRAMNLPSHNASADVARLIVGGLAASLGAVAVAGAIRSKQLDHAEGTEPARVLGVSWSTRFVLAGVVFMAIGMGLIASVP